MIFEQTRRWPDMDEYQLEPPSDRELMKILETAKIPLEAFQMKDVVEQAAFWLSLIAEPTDAQQSIIDRISSEGRRTAHCSCDLPLLPGHLLSDGDGKDSPTH